eukprot:CCRYP_020639-RA/>CCRYP_020639-RA protein AED:0.30 eAED:0.30 QI:0/0/0/1/0/0/3/0/271
MKLHHKAAHKRATSLYASKQSKPEGETKMSASEVIKLVFGEFGVEISKRTIQPEMAEDRIGVSPKKKGPEGVLPRLTCLVLDRSKCNRGGRPEITFYSPNLSNLGQATIKTSVSTTMITGSTAAGEPIPPHFQFSTMAQSEDTQRVNIRMSAFFPRIKGTFGTDCEKEWPVTLGMNLKGGMERIQVIFLNSIVPLFPDAQDVREKRVIMKVDSGPDRMELGFLGEARTLGFIIYPGVPNTTAVTQETDQSYGTFKTQFVKNLKILSDARLI